MLKEVSRKKCCVCKKIKNPLNILLSHRWLMLKEHLIPLAWILKKIANQSIILTSYTYLSYSGSWVLGLCYWLGKQDVQPAFTCFHWSVHVRIINISLGKGKDIDTRESFIDMVDQLTGEWGTEAELRREPYYNAQFQSATQWELSASSFKVHGKLQLLCLGSGESFIFQNLSFKDLHKGDCHLKVSLFKAGNVKVRD